MLSSLFSLIQTNFSSCFPWKSGKVRFFGRKISFQSYSQTFTTLLACGLAVVPVRTEMGNSWICLSLSNQGGQIESSLGKIAQNIKKILSIEWVLPYLYSPTSVAFSHIHILFTITITSISQMWSFFSCYGWLGGLFHFDIHLNKIFTYLLINFNWFFKNSPHDYPVPINITLHYI
jgi:hypothetical protein